MKVSGWMGLLNCTLTLASGLSSMTFVRSGNLGYTFIGWFDGDTELTKELTYTFTMPAENKTYKTLDRKSVV